MIAIAVAPAPTLIDFAGLFMAIAIDVTVPTWLATRAVFPSGVIAIASGSLPTGTGAPAVPVAAAIGTTAAPLFPAASTTRTVLLSGVTASA